MRRSSCVLAVVLAVRSFSFAQENSLKDIYTDITTKINSALLTRRSSIEMSGFVSYHYDRTIFEHGAAVEQHLLQVEPMLSYFLIHDLSLGVDYSYHYTKNVQEPGNSSVITQQSFLGPMIQYYFCDRRWRPFLFTHVLFQSGDAYDGGELGVGGGILFHVSGNIGLKLRIKYGHVWSSRNEIEKQNTVFTGIGLSSFLF